MGSYTAITGFSYLLWPVRLKVMFLLQTRACAGADVHWEMPPHGVVTLFAVSTGFDTSRSKSEQVITHKNKHEKVVIATFPPGLLWSVV